MTATAAEDALARLRQAQGRLSPAEGKVACAVLASPATAMRASIGALAREAKVSEPTVARFCRSLGFPSFPAFKLALAQTIGRGGTPWVSAGIEPDDPPAVYAAKILRASITAIERAAAGLDAAALERAVGVLAGARQIVVFGLGGSGPVAHDAQHKLARLQIPTVAHIDPILQRMTAVTLTAADALLAISVTGRTLPLIEAVDLAAERGARVIALTAPGSPLAARATVVLGVEPSEDSDVYTPMGSRLAHLALIDVLATGAVLARGSAALTHLAAVKASLAATRLPA